MRSLQRGLKEEGTSFSEQLDEVRRAVPLVLMHRPELSVAEVAFMLGYADPRGFYRSFRRWTGHEPSSFGAIGRGFGAWGRCAVGPAGPWFGWRA